MSKEAVKKGEKTRSINIWATLKNLVRPAGVTWLSWKETRKKGLAVICVIAIAAVLLVGFDSLISVALKLLV